MLTPVGGSKHQTMTIFFYVDSHRLHCSYYHNVNSEVIVDEIQH